MPFINADRIKETTTTTGTGPLTLAGAVVGFRSFASVMAIGDTCTYSVVSATLTESEAGIGTYSALNTLTRTTVQSSSNANAAVVFTAGVKNVFIGPIAGTQIPYDPVTGALNLSVNALNDVAITSPTVNQVLKYSGTEWTNQADAVNVGTVTSVSGAGTVSGLTLTGTVTSSGSLTLGGTLSAIPLATGVSGTLPVANGGTGLSTIGTANQVLVVNAGGTALEYQTPVDPALPDLTDVIITAPAEGDILRYDSDAQIWGNAEDTMATNGDSWNTLLRRMNKLMESLTIVDSQQRQKVIVDNILSSATITVVSSQGSLSQLNGGLYGAPTSVSAFPVYEGPVDQRWRIIDDARSCYGINIRSRLTFS